MDEDTIPPFLEKAKPIVRKIKKLCDSEGISRTQLALQYVKRESDISHLVFGVDSLAQLKEDIRLFHESIPDELMEEIGNEFDDIDAEIVMPSLWKK